LGVASMADLVFRTGMGAIVGALIALRYKIDDITT
jgi:predicted acylesterase/phospholipase RssA